MQKIILLGLIVKIGFTYFTNVLQQCGCSGINSDEISSSPYCSSMSSLKSCSNLKTQDDCLSNYPGMECQWSNSTCSQFSTCSKLIVSDPTDCKKQLFGVCSYSPDSQMNQDGTFNCTDTVYQTCANITADYLCIGTFQTRYKMCDWQKNKCVTVDTEKCSSFPNQQSCEYFDCKWESNKCRQKKCSDLTTLIECNKGVMTEYSQGYDICTWNDGTCSSLSDQDKLTAETCYTGSLYTYSWSANYKKCVKCTKTTAVVPVISRLFNASYCGQLYSTYDTKICLPTIRESYTLTVIINILIIYQNGTYFYTDDVSVYLVEQITIIYENNTIMFPNGTYCYDNGTLLEQDGTLTDNMCVTDLKIHYTGYFNISGTITLYPEEIVPVVASERVLIIFKSGRYISISKVILQKVYVSFSVTIIMPDKSYRQPNNDWCYNNYTLVYSNGTQVPNGCLEKPVEQAYLGYYDVDNSYVAFPFAIPNPYLVEIVEIFIVIYTNGTKITASNIYIFVNVTIIFQNNTVILPDASFCFTNGTRRLSDGTLIDNYCPTNVDVYSYGYFEDDKYYDFSGNEKNISDYKPVVEETFDITIIYENGTFVYTQDAVEVEQYVDLNVTIIYPNNTAIYPNKTICDQDGTVIQPNGDKYENACWQKKDMYYKGYYTSSGSYVTYTKSVPNPSNYNTTVIFSNGTKVYTTDVTKYENVTIIYKNSTVVQPNGTIYYYNGTVENTDGTTYQTNTYVDRNTYYQGYYSYSGTYVQYQTVYVYSYYYYGYTYYYYDYDYYDYDYTYYDPQDTYYQSYSSQQTTTTEVNQTTINQQIVYYNSSYVYNSAVYTSSHCRCSLFSYQICETVDYCKYEGGDCVEKLCSDFTESQLCKQYSLLSGCEWKDGDCQSYTGCTGKPVEYVSDCVKMGRYSCTISWSNQQQSYSNYYCQDWQQTDDCKQYSKYDCYNYGIKKDQRCIWQYGYCQSAVIKCSSSYPKDACLLFDCHYDVENQYCRYKQCTDITNSNQCHIVMSTYYQYSLCTWYNGNCFNANDPYSLTETTCAQSTYGTYHFTGSYCTQCYYQYQSLGVLLGIILLNMAI